MYINSGVSNAPPLKSLLVFFPSITKPSTIDYQKIESLQTQHGQLSSGGADAFYSKNTKVTCEPKSFWPLPRARPHV